MTPALFTQLNNGTPTKGVDCAVMTIMMGVHFGTKGRWRPSVSQIRTAAANPDKGLTMAQWQRALRWCEAEARRRGFPFQLTMHRPAASIATLRDRLADGEYAGVAVEYRIINEQFPAGSGQRNLSYRIVDGKRVPIYHALGLFGLRKVAGTNRTTVYDPLYDGRTKSWGTAPNAPVDAPFPVYRDAMAGYAGKGLFLGFTIGDEPPPPPP
ncbi:MAG TPA: hypothetical protein VM305_07580, partial [Candidatus Limnocylindrales bacterium]|nr:hypothetical protein [Candidatus Limnocylindrales bacterium]